MLRTILALCVAVAMLGAIIAVKLQQRKMGDKTWHY